MFKVFSDAAIVALVTIMINQLSWKILKLVLRIVMFMMTLITG